RPTRRRRVGRRPAAVSPVGVSGEHSGLSERVHRELVARAADAARSVYGVRRVRALLPGGRDHAGRRRDVRRLLLLQVLRRLRGRLPGSRRRLDGRGGRVSRPLPQGRTVMTSNEAVAYAVVLARAQAIGCYPITPQTLIVERLAELTVGRDDVEFANLESEHSMFGYVIAAARAGVRAFTATSSQGLLYAHEQLHRASRERVSLVAVNVNRAVLAPWSLEPDLADSMSQRDTGWIQLYCSSGQEVLDTVLCAYRIAEEAMLPVLVCAEGFLLSHTSEVVDVPSQEDVDSFLPPSTPPPEWLIDPTEPRTYAAVAQPDEYYGFQHNVAAALEDARHSIGEVADAFAAQFGRTKVAGLDVHGAPDGSRAIVAIGTVAETALELLEHDSELRVVRVHAYRPFPADELGAALAGVETVAVVDRAPAFGALGPLGSDVLSLDLGDARVRDFVCGLGGARVTPSTLSWMLAHATAPGASPAWVPVGV